MPRRLSPAERYKLLLDLYFGRIESAWLTFYSTITGDTILKDLTASIAAEDITGAFETLGINAASVDPLLSEIEAAFKAGGDYKASTFPKRLATLNGGRVQFRFDSRNLRAETWLRQNSSSLVTQLSNEGREQVRTVLKNGMIAGDNPERTAIKLVGAYDRTLGRRVGGRIGIAPNQEIWVQNARRDLVNLDANYFTRTLRDRRYDPMVRNAIATGKPLTITQVDSLTQRYVDRVVKYRGNTIARTETIEAVNRADFEATMQTIERGAAKAEDVTRIWDTSGNANVRHSHREMEGQRRALTEPFKTGDGFKMMHPGDRSLGAPVQERANCACRVRTEVDWLAQVNR